MRKAIVFALLVVVAAVVYLNFIDDADRSAHDASPAFQVMLDQAVDRLEGVPERITATAVAEAQAEPLATAEYTCSDFRTCDAIATCDGSVQPTCDGEITCDYSTCEGALTCTNTCEQYTIGEGPTCDGSATCAEGPCPGWPTYDGFNPTCVGGPTCEPEGTCLGFVSCSGCGTATERTTWGEIKAKFGK